MDAVYCLLFTVIMIHSSWNKLFDEYNIDLEEHYKCKRSVYPPKNCVFRAFEMPLSNIKVVLLGQDPYHGPGQAHGLSFSVPDGVAIPPSLRNIQKELQIEFPERNYKYGKSGNLEKWVQQGIFLLNAALTVEEGRPNSHSEVWAEFTDDVITYIAANTNCIFILLGNYAKTKDKFIKDKNRIVYGVHPSPLSAHRGFFNSGIFKEVEEKLCEEIDWNI